MSKINKKSFDLVEEHQEWLKEKFPSCFVEGKLDFEKLKQLVSDISIDRNEHYSFSWMGRNESIKKIQNKTTGTLISQNNESINFDDTENIFVEGENLEVLKLLQKSYSGKVKMIYIDPPYNTGHDFIYKDDFSNSLESYLEQTEQSKKGLKLTSNPETSGRFHSDWMSFMYSRLFLARIFLKDDGIIFVSIDDNEVNNLRNLMNEIFGEENFLACSTWQKKYGAANDAKGISTTHEYVLIFAKNSNVWIPGLLDRTDEQLTAFKNSDSDLRGPWRASDLSARTYSSKCDYEIIGPTGKKFRPPPSRSWIVNKSKFQELLHDNRITFGKDNDSRPMTKNFLNEVRQGITPDTWWKREKAGDNKEARYELKKIFPENIFDTPKPIKLINLCIKIANCIHDDIILDFFAGSGSTAHATLAANNNDGGSRKFICVQIPEKCPDNSTAQKEGFNTISDICKERIRRVIKKIKDEQKQNKIDSKSNQDLGFKVFKLAKSNYKIWQDVKDEAKLKEQLKLFEDPLIKNYKDLDVIYEIIIKEGYSLNSKIEEFQKKPNKIYKISDADFFFYVTLDKQVNSESLEKLKLDNTVMFVCLDSAINDSQKTNLDKLCKLRTI